jgi:hypothetical protein
MTESVNKNKGGMIVLLIFLLICSGLGIASFVMSFTKKCGEGFEDKKHDKKHDNKHDKKKHDKKHDKKEHDKKQNCDYNMYNWDDVDDQGHVKMPCYKRGKPELGGACTSMAWDLAKQDKYNTLSPKNPCFTKQEMEKYCNMACDDPSKPNLCNRYNDTGTDGLWCNWGEL